MIPTSVFPGANSAVTAPVTNAADAPPAASSETQTDGQASFARIMSDATTDNTTGASPSSLTRVPAEKGEKDGKRGDDKAQAQAVAQIASTLVPPQTPPPLPIVSTIDSSGGGATPCSVPVCAETIQASRPAVGGVLELVTASSDKAAGNDPRNLANSKKPSIQLMADGIKPSLMPCDGSAKETQSSVANDQLPVTEALVAPNTNTAPVESATQPALVATVGMAIAKQVGRMKMQDKAENNSEVAEKNLPPASFVAQAGATSDAAKPRTTPVNLPQREERSTTTTGASVPILAGLVQGKAQPADNHAGADAARSPQADKVFAEISERVLSFKRMGADSAEVNLRPDNSTEITLSLSLRNGQVEMTARLERGNLSALNPHWTGLQQSLSQQGVRVGQLTSSQSAMNDQLSSGTSHQSSGENASRSFERGPESLDDLSVAGSITEPLKGRPQRAVAMAGRGWEMWA